MTVQLLVNTLSCHTSDIHASLNFDQRCELLDLKNEPNNEYLNFFN